MARKPRIHFSGAFYHVMLRGNGGDNIFFSDEDRYKFLSLLNECVNRFNCRIHAFCLMTNHVHLAIQVGEISLSKIIQNISFRYTRIINKKKNKIGHLFQGRYKAILVDADNYLLQLVRYIHLNPVRAKIVKNPEEYMWSSHKTYIELNFFEWLTKNYVLGIFSEIKTQAITQYEKYMRESVFDNSNKINFSTPNQKTFPVICDDAFMKKLELMQKMQIEKSAMTLEEIARLVCIFYKIDESQLHKKSHEHFNAKVRAMIARVGTELKIATLTQVATYFNRDISTVSRFLNKKILFVNDEADKIREFIRKATTQA